MNLNNVYVLYKKSVKKLIDYFGDKSNQTLFDSSIFKNVFH